MAKPDLYSITVALTRKGRSGLRTWSAPTTMSCALSAAVTGCAAKAIPKITDATLNMAQRVHDGQARGAIGRHECRECRHQGEHYPYADDRPRSSQQVQFQRNGVCVPGG